MRGATTTFVPRLPRFSSVVSPICFALSLAGCGRDGPTDPPTFEPGVRVITGGDTDTVDARLRALVVEVRGAQGALATGVVVRFESQFAQTASDTFEPVMFVCSVGALVCGGDEDYFAVDTTDAQGLASVTVRMGHVAGPAMIEITVPELGLTGSATFTVTPGAAVDVHLPVTDIGLDIGTNAAVGGYVVDHYGNRRPDVPTFSVGPGSAITLDATTGVVTARDVGTQWVFTRYASAVDSTRVRVLPSGRLVVWSPSERLVRLVNINGSGERTFLTGIASDFGAFPRFDATRRKVILHDGPLPDGGPSIRVLVADTSGSPVREISPTSGLIRILATRQLPDGAVLVVSQRSNDPEYTGFALRRVETDNSVSRISLLPGIEGYYGGADISHDGARVAYMARVSFSSSSAELRVIEVASGAIKVLDGDATAPRWSATGDRIAYLVPSGSSAAHDRVAAVINADGTGRRILSTSGFSPGIGWSPDGTYIVGRSSGPRGLLVIRVTDGAEVLLRFPGPGGDRDYWQPDWR